MENKGEVKQKQKQPWYARAVKWLRVAVGLRRAMEPLKPVALPEAAKQGDLSRSIIEDDPSGVATAVLYTDLARHMLQGMMSQMVMMNVPHSLPMFQQIDTAFEKHRAQLMKIVKKQAPRIVTPTQEDVDRHAANR